MDLEISALKSLELLPNFPQCDIRCMDDGIFTKSNWQTS